MGEEAPGRVPPMQSEMERRRWEAEKLEEVVRSLESSLMCQLSQMVAEAGLSAAAGAEAASHLRPTVGGKAPTKSFYRKAL